MFLLAQLDSTNSVGELVDIAPCDRAETMRRLHQLARFQVVELSAETAEERAELARHEAPRAPEPPRAAKLAPVFDEESTTLRPPPQKQRPPRPRQHARAVSEDEAATLRPPAPLSVDALMKEATDDSTVRAIIDRSSGVVEKQVNIEFRTPREAVGADGQPVRDRSVFSRQTLVDADSESRARQLEEPLPVRRR